MKNTGNVLIKTIIFDLGKVIVDYDHMLICEKLSRYSPLKKNKIHEIIFKSGLEPSFDKGLVSPEKFYRCVKNEARLKISINDFRKIWTGIFSLIPGTADILTALKAKYRLLCLSNTNKWHFEHCMEKFPLLALIDDFILSYEIGKIKPEKIIFRKALQKSGALPANCIYIDDVQEFIDEAEKTGINGILFTTAENLRIELQDMNVI